MTSLSVCCMTGDPPARVAAALALLRPVAAEIVVAVDSRVDPGELAAYDGVADRVVRFAFQPPVDRPRAWLVAQCTGEWVLSIDGDEVPGRALVEALPDLVAATDVVQYWLPRRWLHPDTAHWLAETPWWPDFQVRLMRNGPTLASRAELHAGFVPVLPSRHVEAPLYHLDCVVNPPDARAAKAARYEAEAPGRAAYGGGGLNDVMYLPEHWATAPPRPLPAADRAAIEAVLAAGAAGRATNGAVGPGPAPGAGRAAPAELVSDADIDRLASSPVLAEADYAVALEPFDDGPLRLAPGEVRPVHVRVGNRGGAVWRWGLDQQPEIRVAYHWRAPDGRITDYEGLRTPLPCTVGPGESTVVAAWVRAPEQTGDHVLELDLVHEHVRWFDSPLAVPVVVAERAPARRDAADDDAQPAPGATAASDLGAARC